MSETSNCNSVEKDVLKWDRGWASKNSCSETGDQMQACHQNALLKVILEQARQTGSGPGWLWYSILPLSLIEGPSSASFSKHIDSSDMNSSAWDLICASAEPWKTKSERVMHLYLYLLLRLTSLRVPVTGQSFQVKSAQLQVMAMPCTSFLLNPHWLGFSLIAFFLSHPLGLFIQFLASLASLFSTFIPAQSVRRIFARYGKCASCLLDVVHLL